MKIGPMTGRRACGGNGMFGRATLRIRVGAAGAVVCAAVTYIPPAQAVDLAAAEQQFMTSCGTCHTVVEGAPPRQGPNLHSAYGRPAGTLPDFKYSAVLKTGGWTWDETTLDPWIENAQANHPGTFMNYRQADPAKRQLIIQYLKSLAPPN
jgi:cytochrome c